LVAVTTNFYKLSNEPLIYVISSGWGMAPGLSVCLSDARRRPCEILVVVYWHLIDIADELIAQIHQIESLFTEVRITVLCAASSDVDLLQLKGVHALHVHANALIDEEIYKVDNSVQKQFSALHNANMASWKRHFLAWNVQGVAVITYAIGGNIERTSTGTSVFSTSFETAQAKAAFDGYIAAKFLNFSYENGVTLLSHKDVCSAINRSHCGLILSEKEGGNFASAECLLSGVPIVSTESVGGRDVFFNQQDVTIVPPDANAVNSAVMDWTRRQVDPEAIRTRILKKFLPHRRRLLDWLTVTTGKDWFQDTNENLWSPQFVDKLRQSVTREVTIHVQSNQQ
jgi:glycosyltransferase involved in cell wall biosynthesis